MTSIFDYCCSSRNKTVHIKKSQKIDFNSTSCARCTRVLKDRQQIKTTAKSANTYYYFCSIGCYELWLKNPRPHYTIL